MAKTSPAHTDLHPHLDVCRTALGYAHFAFHPSRKIRRVDRGNQIA